MFHKCMRLGAAFVRKGEISLSLEAVFLVSYRFSVT
jgi:hypothetical protein